MSGVAHKGFGLRILGVSLASLNLLLWLFVPAVRAFIDETTGRWANPRNPQIVTAVQEQLQVVVSVLPLTTFRSVAISPDGHFAGVDGAKAMTVQPAGASWQLKPASSVQALSLQSILPLQSLSMPSSQISGPVTLQLGSGPPSVPPSLPGPPSPSSK